MESSKAFNTLSKILLRIKPSYFSIWFVTVENVCDSWCMHQNETGLFSSAAVSHKVNLLSCVARRPLCNKVNLPRCEVWRCHFIMTCDIFGTEQTNILALCYLFGKKLINQPTVAPLKSLKSIHSTKLLETLLTWAAHTFHWLSLWWFPWNVWNLVV